jgi:hypothetical protein
MRAAEQTRPPCERAAPVESEDRNPPGGHPTRGATRHGGKRRDAN